MAPSITPDSLVLYKVRPARVISVSDKIEIELDEGKTKRVRDKDISLLHPGPVGQLSELHEPEGDVDEAWALLEGTRTDIRELAELAFGSYTPSSAWAAWQRVADGLYFEGTPDAIIGRPGEQVEADRIAREAKVAAETAWEELIGRLAAGEMGPDDRKELAEVERLACGRSQRSRILSALGYAETPENAHRLLVSVAYWESTHNPHPGRLELPMAAPGLPVPDLPDDPRMDLTHLPAFAIDDEGNQDPDDAISLEGDRLWVHVADVAALVVPGGDLDLEARARAANLYLPERMVPMLPDEVTHRLGLGLQAVSPALSFGMRLDADGQVDDIEISPSWVKVTRLTYAQVEEWLDQTPFSGVRALTERFRERRLAQGAVALELPEVTVRVADGEVQVRPMQRLYSREMVTDAMLMAGQGAARFAQERGLAIAYATQAPPEEERRPGTLSQMYAYRRLLKPTQASTVAAPHAGLGLPAYARATSPLRRYQDLLVHQQIRAQLLAGEPLDTEAVARGLAAAESAAALIRKAERLSNQHWKLVYLSQTPDWRGEAHVVDADDRKLTLLIPELAMETRLRARGGLGPDARLQLAVREVSLPDQAAYFRVL
jgi:exoribonuclease-2